MQPEPGGPEPAVDRAQQEVPPHYISHQAAHQENEGIARFSLVLWFPWALPQEELLHVRLQQGCLQEIADLPRHHQIQLQHLLIQGLLLLDPER